MTSTLTILLRVAGAVLLLLAAMHRPISRKLKWCEESLLLSPVNAAIFRVHALFICIVLILMGSPCIADPRVFLERNRAGAWLAWTFAAFWTARLFVQWFVFPRTLWQARDLKPESISSSQRFGSSWRPCSSPAARARPLGFDDRLLCSNPLCKCSPPPNQGQKSKIQHHHSNSRYEKLMR